MQEKIEDSGFAPSFSCYSSDSITSTAVAKVIREVGDVEGDDFEFSFVFNQNLMESDEVVSKIKAMDGKIVASSSAITSSSSSNSSSEADESESPSYCVWRPKVDGGSSPVTSKCKKSSSTGSGSGSKQWIFRYLIRRTNSEGKQPMVLLTPKMVDSPKHKRNSGEVLKTGGRLKAQTPVHEQFYVQRRAENEVQKRKSYLPYRKDLVGLFANVNGMGKILPF